ncbi:TetR/AcrR family transcriptional regulator [Massilia litorea]|jgi:AcrR family transcriptional regulator|uniref:TetR/AcrR family transcriptional regulator n=1 Tax=Massilia litorea TaxID=2769491 RepID=A0A7L9UCA0_9BURK|nr:TetR/AcrR family transcriptional regulator [Massilia litorea]QOL51795.1 TetR/AcrR family transcriptional regulator [Massilia litorea]
MPNQTSSAIQPPSTVSRTNLQAGRASQKQRTYQALLDAALVLSEAGQQPTLQDIARKAMVSRATAYRYFPSVDALIHEAYFGRGVVPLDEVMAPGAEPVQAAGRAADAMNRLLLGDEAGVHIVERAFMQMWLDNASEERPARMARRMNYIDPIVASLADRLDDAARSRLRTALAMTMGTEAILAMRDVAGASREEAVAASIWAAQSLVRQALAEAGR